MASPSCASTLPWSSAFSSSSYRLTNSRCSPSLVIVAQGKVKKYRQVILTEDVEEAGKKGDSLEVRAGFYRNFLLPKGKAQLLTPEVLKTRPIPGERGGVPLTKKLTVKEEAQQLARVFETIGAFKISRKGGKGKQIFGRDVDKRLVTVPEIREVGEYVADIKLHPDVTARVRLNVYAK